MNEDKELIKIKLFNLLSVLLESDNVNVTGTLEEYSNKQYIQFEVSGIKDNGIKDKKFMNEPK